MAPSTPLSWFCNKQRLREFLPLYFKQTTERWHRPRPSQGFVIGYGHRRIFQNTVLKIHHKFSIKIELSFFIFNSYFRCRRSICYPTLYRRLCSFFPIANSLCVEPEFQKQGVFFTVLPQPKRYNGGTVNTSLVVFQLGNDFVRADIGRALRFQGAAPRPRFLDPRQPHPGRCFLLRIPSKRNTQCALWFIRAFGIGSTCLCLAI